MNETIGNTTLVEYGIKQWAKECDLMFHVSVATKRVYRYEPKKAVKAIENKEYAKRTAKQGNITTATGWLVPPNEIEGCLMMLIPFPILQAANFSPFDNPSEKGRKAEKVVRDMIRSGYLSLTLDVINVTDPELQLDGLDIISIQATNIQVKCDWNAGPRELGGTGNLFIQETESNPRRLH